MDEMRDRVVALAKRYRNKCSDFLRSLIVCASESQREEAIANLVKAEMMKLGFDAVQTDRIGNVIGRIGDGDTILMFDAHMDTPGIGDRAAWRFDPYQGEVKAGKIYGHGATNNKGGLAAMLYAGSIIKELDLALNCTIYFVATVQAEQCEGLAYKSIFDVEKLYPHFTVLTMPTGMRICRGHRGRVELRATVRGLASHASAPDKGENPIYGISQLIDKVREMNASLPDDPFFGKATMTVTHVDTVENGPNMIPEMCILTIDRRLLPGETSQSVLKELEPIAKATKAKIEVIEFDQASYRGLRLPMDKYFPTWSLPEDHELVESVNEAYRNVYKKPPTVGAWTMSTAGAYTMGHADVPTVGIGPSEEGFSGPINDHVRVDDLEKCMAIYALIPDQLPETEPIRNVRRRR